jgi:coenzyme F420-0:L-glutamate ligase / coenzyme F420-1:gamma-L-glutamate ligase
MLMSGFQRAQTIRDAISGRRSIRQYSSDDVSPDTVRRLIGMAVMAPSAHNRQPWRVVVVRDVDIKLRLADAMGVRLRNDRTRDGDDPEAIERDVARSHLRISEAPVLLAVCLTMEDMDRYPDERRNRAEFLMAVQSTAVAVENLMVAASGEELGTCWMCAPLFCPDVVRAVLELPAAWEPKRWSRSAGRPASQSRSFANRSTRWLSLPASTRRVIQDDPASQPTGHCLLPLAARGEKGRKAAATLACRSGLRARDIRSS